ncbi:MAG: sodium:proton antiporter [Bosea sp. (in: a-proteobacteria)]|uniref:sodium:proton antiporter n=1 Tax=unclassified Bosea (in: a-proteobacteria) TaxID=2653178 RepID=UPI000959697C|nr:MULTISPECIES: sodium:proton antiporter [unclassified Bosea (in: a-proteobacteria)]MBN9457995.1 sodium:proton antiporter [Bosea sp. (in: a-proteobacteria)]OJV10516.1 MAG: sodium:proton antiporter [Bosea sp. 67-29]
MAIGWKALAGAGLASLVPGAALAAGDIGGATMGPLWALPFAGMLLSIALGPILFHHLWELHYGKFAAFWALLLLVPLVALRGFEASLGAVLHTALLEYLPFIILLFSLFTIAGGILITGNLHGSPATNTVILAIGTVMASIVGTTGASMILIRPLLRANDNRRHNVHVVVFFIFLVSNIGGSLTPLGDPPLFLGFLRGVDFFWTTEHLLPETGFAVVVLLALFYALDSFLYHRDDSLPPLKDPTPDRDLKLWGKVNLPLLAGVIGAILLSANWKPGVVFELHGVHVELQNLVRDLILIGLAGLSLWLTPKQVRAGNEFSWGPILEVAKLFAGIFVCIIPVLAMLQAGREGAFSALVGLVNHPDGSHNAVAYFWLTGILSSFLDNAPTYLVFFELAGGNAKELMTTGALTLAAISGGAVFMGANTYIGNAPNFMVYAIAKDRKVAMPSFFGYMLWSGAILIPVFIVQTVLFFG